MKEKTPRAIHINELRRALDISRIDRTPVSKKSRTLLGCATSGVGVIAAPLRAATSYLVLIDKKYLK